MSSCFQLGTRKGTDKRISYAIMSLFLTLVFNRELSLAYFKITFGFVSTHFMFHAKNLNSLKNENSILVS